MVFIPRWERYKDKKPVGQAEYNTSSEFSKLFDAFYVFDSIDPDDLVGYGDKLNRVQNPADGGTSTFDKGFHDYGVTVTAVDVPSGTTQSTKFSAITATGDTTTFWHKSLSQCSIFADCTLSAIVGGPMNLFGFGGRANGLEIIYRSSPKKLSIIAANNYSKAEAQSTNIFNPGSERIRILGVFDNGILKMFVRTAHNTILESQITASYTTIPAHAATPDILGAGSSNAVGDANYTIVGDGWNGDCYALGISKSYAPSDDEAIAFLNAPYQILKSRRKWYYFADATNPNINLLFGNIYSNSNSNNILLSQQHNILLLDGNSNANIDTTQLSQTHNINVLNSDSNSFVDNTNLSQTHNVIATDILSNSQIDSITIQLANIINLAFVNIESNTTADTLTLSQTSNLSLLDINSNAFEDNISVTQQQILNFLELQSSSDISTIAISQGSVIALGLANINSNSSLDSVNIEQTLLLSLSNIETIIDCDTINLLQNNVLVLSDSVAQSIIDNINLLGLGLGAIYKPEIKIKSSEKYKIIVLAGKNI